ncbi:MAG: phosphatidate cytidylyltransferase [Bacteroidaceae bacterium]|nr:phosphatidate cytidylyltransferase [Bacteroidaceae bacterium]MBQ5393311.1 phosphatidate cytidylyltransferase [Bacteroidaceae bacterium]MBQ5911911.1 phosphatidate cytidylyltransferase [Bacteroidaceae bacterium]
MNNFIVRTLTGVAFVAVLVASIVYSPFSFGALFAVVSALSTMEFCNIVNKQAGVQTNVFISILASLMLFFAIFAYSCGYANAVLLMPSSVFLPYLLTIIYLLVSQLYSGRENALASWAFTMMGQLYVALPFALLNCIAFVPYPQSSMGTAYIFMYPLAVFLFLWSSDSGAYCVGSLLGKKIPYRLFPSISPNKSWIGSIGGTLLAVGVGAIISRFEPSLTLLQWMGFGLVVAIFGTWGDLVESQIKRQLGIKDSGNVLPGHGGMLDRFDSSLLAIPASLIYLHFIWSL